MKRPSLKKLTAAVQKWNAAHPVGTPVTRFALVNPLRDGTPATTLSNAWVLSNHSAVILVSGISGAVLLESVIPRPSSLITDH